MSGAKLFQQRYETSRCCPRAGGTPAARIPARPAPVVVVNCRRVNEGMPSPCAFSRGSWGGTARRISHTAESSARAILPQLPEVAARPGFSRRPALVALAEDFLVELADARLGYGV